RSPTRAKARRRPSPTPSRSTASIPTRRTRPPYELCFCRPPINWGNDPRLRGGSGGFAFFQTTKPPVRLRLTTPLSGGQQRSAMSQVVVPDIGDFKEVEVIEVLVKPGDKIDKEQSLVTLESDKATMEIPSPAAGVVKEIRIKTGDKVSQGSVILMLEGAEQRAEPRTEAKT